MTLLQAAQGDGGMGMILMLVAMFAIMYFFMIRPQQKKQKEIQKFRISAAHRDVSISVLLLEHSSYMSLLPQLEVYGLEIKHRSLSSQSKISSSHNSSEISTCTPNSLPTDSYSMPSHIMD